MASEAELLALGDRVVNEKATDALTMAIIELDYHTPGGIGLSVNYDPLMWMERNGADPLTSTDSAMAIIPPGWFTRFAAEDRHSRSWRWELRGGYGWDVGVRAPTQAQAITAAALHAHSVVARAATMGGSDD